MTGQDGTREWRWPWRRGKAAGGEVLPRPASDDIPVIIDVDNNGNRTITPWEKEK